MRLPYLIAATTAAACIAAALLGPQIEAKQVVPGFLAVAFTVTGTVIALRERRNVIGWLFLGCGLAASLVLLTHAITDRLIADGRAGATITGVLAAYGSAGWVPMMLPALTLTLLLFPTGRSLPGRGWRVLPWCAVAGMALTFFALLTAAHPEDYKQLDNPLAVGAKGSDGPGFMLMIVSLIGGPISLRRRYRQADLVMREQIKWLTLAGAVAAVAFLVGLALDALLATQAVYVLAMLGVLALPVSVAVAILRYRLYDIDVVINRALVYAALTVTLVGAYLVTVLVAQLVLPARSDLGVAVSTLAAAALFAPARARIQAAVDRRFFRRRYDAAQTLLAFGATLRDEVDLNALSDELRGVVADTMQPAHVSLWLRP